ncbi:hypothetical protein J6590_005960 [Homalodisca vitripennis]|nr:hypothetical protein J6590_005960 [Homalodisca vitripennis]
MERRKFLREVGLEMIKPHVAKRATISSLPKMLRSSILKVANVQEIPHRESAVNRPAGSRHMETFCNLCQNMNNGAITDSD